MGHALDSINIPLQEIESKISEIRQLDGKIVLCCASGNRSGMAQQFLQSQNIVCHNGGSWYMAEINAKNL